MAATRRVEEMPSSPRLTRAVRPREGPARHLGVGFERDWAGMLHGSIYSSRLTLITQHVMVRP
jgi:hypothetical protein